MKTLTEPHQLGQNIVVLMDDSPGFLDALRTVASCLPQIEDKFFTLLCCCPTHYWGHGGEDTPELKDFIKSVREEEETGFNLAEQRLDRAKSILLDVGVPIFQILTRTSTDDSLLDATMAELKCGKYSGVVVSRSQCEIVNRLRGSGLSDRFRQIPKVEVWAIDTEQVIQTQTRKE